MAPSSQLPITKADHVLPEKDWLSRVTSTTTTKENLFKRVGGDVVAAGCAAALVMPVVCCVDRAIIERASSRSTIRHSLATSLRQILTRPHHFVSSKASLLISALYFGTYLTANTVDTVSSIANTRPAESTTSGSAKFLATSTVNMSLCLYKDSQFARLFGPLQPASAPVRPLPLPSYALFALRDSLTIFASFNLAPYVSTMLPPGIERHFHMSSSSTAQILVPAVMQLFSTPLHLWGLDLYNRPDRTINLASRLRRVGRDWLSSSAARMCRVIPAFGIGGVANASVRKRMMQGL